MSDATYPDAACQDAEDIMYIDSDHGVQQLSFVVGQTWMIVRRPSTELTWAAQRGNHTHMCPHCGITLLTGEYAGFCCGKNGSRLNDIQELPALPPEYAAFINHPDISCQSRRLNLIFSFASLETTANFSVVRHGFFAIQGKIYHRI